MRGEEGGGERQGEQGVGGGGEIKGREAETRPGQSSGATGDVDGAEDKGNNAAAGSCLVPAAVLGEERVKGRTRALPARVMSRRGFCPCPRPSASLTKGTRAGVFRD